MKSSTEHVILAQEEKLRTAMLQSNVHVLDQLLSPKLVFTNHFGQVMSKEDDLQAHQSGKLKIDEITLSEQVVQNIGDVICVNTRAVITGSYDGLASKSDFRFTRIWAKTNNAWQVAFAHSSLIV